MKTTITDLLKTYLKQVVCFYITPYVHRIIQGTITTMLHLSRLLAINKQQPIFYPLANTDCHLFMHTEFHVIPDVRKY